MFMIRDFTIYCKLISIYSLKDIDLFNHAMLTFNPQNCICPQCGSKYSCASSSDSYQRYLISYENHKIVVHTLSVSIVQCTSCKKNHAILPVVIVPFATYSIFFILRVLGDYFSPLRASTIQSLCNKYQIAISTLYKWISLFKTHKKLWLGILDDHNISSFTFIENFFNDSLSFFQLLRSFVSKIGKSFLQFSFQTSLYNSS